MIKVKDGEIEVRGTGVEIMTELSLFVHSLKEKTELEDEDIRQAVELGLKDVKDVFKETKKMILDFMKGLVKDLEEEDGKDE